MEKKQQPDKKKKWHPNTKLKKLYEGEHWSISTFAIKIGEARMQIEQERNKSRGIVKTENTVSSYEPRERTIRRWLSGESLPSEETREAIQRLFPGADLGFDLPEDQLALADQEPEEHAQISLNGQASQQRLGDGTEYDAIKQQSSQKRKCDEVLDEAPETLSSFSECVSTKEATPPRQRRLQIMVAGLSSLIVMFLILGMVSRFIFAQMPVPSDCGGTSSDDFHGNLASGWEPLGFGTTTEGSTTYHLTKTSLDLSATTNSRLDFNPALNFNAPRFLRSITGNFTIETCLEFRPKKNFQSAGILLWQDQKHYLRFERGFGGPIQEQQSGVFLQAWDHGVVVHDSGLQNQLTTAGSVELRLHRQGDSFAASWREPGQQAWHDVGTYLFLFEHMMAGVDLIVDYDAPPITASFTYFKVVSSKN